MTIEPTFGFILGVNYMPKDGIFGGALVFYLGPVAAVFERTP